MKTGTVFQKMRQFFGVNSGGSNASGMLLNKLGVHSGCSLSLGSFAGITTIKPSSSSDEDEENTEEKKNQEKNVVRLDELSAVVRRIAPNLKTDLPSVCPKLEMFYRSITDKPTTEINDDDDDEDEDDVDFETGDLDAFDEAEREEAALEDLMFEQNDEEMITVNKNVTNTQVDIDDRAEQERHFDALEIAIRGATLCNTNTQKSAAAECNYDYFDRSWLRQQGSQWRRRRRMQWDKEQKQNSAGVTTAKAGKRKRRAAFFFNFSEKLTDEELTSLKATKTVSGKRAPHTWNPKTDDALVKIQQKLLLDDGDLEDDDDVSDVTAMGRLFLNPSIGLRDETTSSTKNDDTEEKVENDDDGDDFDAAVPDYDGGFDDDDDDDVEVNFALDDKSAPLEFLDNFKASNLVEAEHKVEKQTIHYETVAKRVDVGRLKNSIWNSIETKVETVEKTTEAITLTQKEESKQDESKNIEEEDKTCCFKTIMEKLSSTREVPENVTVPFYFICTLHLANEHGLLLSHRDRLEEASKQDGMTSGASLEPAALSDLNDFIIVAPDESEWN